jgi:hypothetical protein
MLFGVTAAQAGTVRYDFAGSLDDGTKITAYLEILSLPTNTSSTSGLGVYEAGDAPPFMDWSVTIGSELTPSGDFRNETIHVRDNSPDSVAVSSQYEDNSFDLVFTAEDGSSFSGVGLPDLDRDWESISLRYTDWTGDDPVVQEGTVVVAVVPLPPAALTGVGLLAGLGLMRRLRRRR